MWEAALDSVQPQNLILFAERPAFETPQTLLTHLTGLLKYAQRAKNGQVSAGELAALTGQTEATIRICFAWFTANTELTLSPDSEDMYRVEIDPARLPPKSGDDLARLKRLFTETHAYREYWRKQRF